MPRYKLEVKKIKGNPSQNEENSHQTTRLSISHQKDMIINQ